MLGFRAWRKPGCVCLLKILLMCVIVRVLARLTPERTIENIKSPLVEIHEKQRLDALINSETKLPDRIAGAKGVAGAKKEPEYSTTRQWVHGTTKRKDALKNDHDGSLSDPEDQKRSDERIKKKRETYAVGKSSETLLVLFSTWALKKGKEHVRRSILGTWRTWYPELLPVLFTESAEAKREAEEYAWGVLNVGETACADSHMPTLRGMFKDIIVRYNNTASIYGFANGDLLFDAELRNTMDAFLKSQASVIQSRPVMILGKRINVKVGENTTVASVDDVKQLAVQGQYPAEGSSDLFFTNHLFPWNRIPEIVVGRIGFGMWIVAFARANNVTVYDVTETVTAVHMTTGDGIFESHKSSNSFCNHKLFREKRVLPKSFDCGWINCSGWRSEFSESGSILFRKVSKRSLWPRCHACD